MFDRRTKPNARTTAPLGCCEQRLRRIGSPPGGKFRNRQRLLDQPRKARANWALAMVPALSPEKPGNDNGISCLEI
jgi:hypothetical protein